MKFKKIASIFTVLVLTLSLGACNGADSSSSGTVSETPVSSTAGSESETEEEISDTDVSDIPAGLEDIIPDETVELIAYSQLANYSGEQIGWFAEVLKEKFNVKLTVINEADGTFDTRMASGDLGDIILFNNDSTTYISAVNAGMLYDWDEENLLETYGKDIDETMQLALEKNRNLSGGTLYGFGHDVASSSKEHAAFSYRPDIRWDLYEKLGYPEVNTLEDFIEVLEDMVELEPASDTGNKTYGVSLFPDWDSDMVMFVKSTAALYGYEGFGLGLYDTKTQTFEDCLKDDGAYLRCLKFYHELYKRGLLDPDSMTQTTDDVREDYLTGAAFFCIFDFIGSNVYNTPDHYDAGKAMLPLAANDQKTLVSGLNVYGGQRVWTIGAKTDYPELCMAIINWLATPEGVMTREYGPKGATWDYDGDGNPYLTETGLQCIQDGETVLEYGGSSATFTDGTFKPNNETWAVDSVNPETNGETYNWLFWKSTQDMIEAPEITQQWRDHTGYMMADDYMEGEDHMSMAIGSSFSMATKDSELETKWNQVATSVRSGSWKAIFAETDEEFDSIVENMKKETMQYGYEECIEFTQGQAEIRKEKEIEAMNAQ